MPTQIVSPCRGFDQRLPLRYLQIQTSAPFGHLGKTCVADGARIAVIAGQKLNNDVGEFSTSQLLQGCLDAPAI